jgi:hypothetical protein
VDPHHTLLFFLSSEVPSNLALYGALGSILFKGTLTLFAHEWCDCTDGHHQFVLGGGANLTEALYHATVRIGKRAGSELLIANAWHHRTGKTHARARARATLALIKVQTQMRFPRWWRCSALPARSTASRGWIRSPALRSVS